MGRITICPFSTTARSLIACMPKMAHCGGFSIGVDNIDPNTPPLVIVKVPPFKSSYVKLPDFALVPKSTILFSIPAKSS